MIEWLKRFFSRSGDPVHGCELYRNEGCSHVDGYLCDFPKCSILNDYRKASERQRNG